MTEPSTARNKSTKIIGIIALFYFILAAFFPKSLWGGHHISFLPAIVQVIIFFLAGYFILAYPSSKEKPLHLSILKPLSKLNNWKTQLLVALGFGVIFYAFPIHLDNYGDAAFLFTDSDIIAQDLNNDDIDNILSFDFTNLKIGTKTTLSLLTWLSHSFEASYKSVFKIWDSLWGIGFIILWLKIITKYIKNDSWKALLVLLGCTASFLQIYFGHFEIYAPVFTSLLLYFYVLLSVFDSINKRKLILLAFVLIFCLKFHVTSFLLVPSFLITLYFFIQKDLTKITTIPPKRMFKNFFFPIAILGVIFYFFMGSFNHARSFTTETYLDNVFLPVSTSEPAPLDRYNLFSLYHIFDFGNMMIQWSAAAIFLLTSVLIGFRKKLNWSSTPLLIVITTLLFQIGFFFLFNPLLSMPNDWDIMSIPAVTLLILILLITKQIQNKDVSKQITGTVFALSIFSVSIFIVNNNKSALSQKLQTQGEWEFQTYWVGSSSSILAGLSLEENLLSRNERLSHTTDNLEQYATLGNDIEYAELLHQEGKYYFNRQEYSQALTYFDKSDAYSNYLCKNHYHQLVCSFMLGDFASAHQHSSRLLSCQLPTAIRSYEITLHTSLEAGDLVFADSICTIYLNKWPSNDFIEKVQKQIRSGKNPKEMFASGYVNQKKISQEMDSLNRLQLNLIDSLQIKIHETRDSAIIGNDKDFNHLLTSVGKYYFKKQEYSNCLTYFSEALKYSNDDCETNYHILISHFMLKQITEAQKYSDLIIECKYPNPQKAYKIALHTCVEGQYFGQAEQYCLEYLKQWPDDEFISNLFNAITTEKTPKEIQSFFRQK